MVDASCMDKLMAVRNSDAPPAHKAAKLITSLSSKCGNTAAYKLEMGSYYIALEEYDTAREYLTAVANGEKSVAHYGSLGLGKIHLHKKDYESAIQQFSKIVNSHPSWDKGYEHLGIAYVHNDEYEKAIVILNQGLEITKSNHQIYRYLGFASYYQSNPEDAIKYLDKAFSLNKNLILDKNVMLVAARSNIQLKKYDVARALLTILISNISDIENDPEYIAAVKYYNDESDQ